MKIIYEPKGAALEYAPLAVNLYSGCAHGCKYCYVPGVMRRAKEDFHSNVTVREDALKLFEADCRELADKGDDREVLLSFTTDPYQPIERELEITRTAIKILKAYGLRFTILTKGGPLAERDFDLLAGYEKCSFGTTLIFDNLLTTKAWEPLAASPGERVNAINQAKSFGIKTWVSLEPVIVPVQTLTIVGLTAHVVDHWKVGKINHNKALENQDWAWFCRELKAIFDANNSSYYVKDSLRPYWPEA